jgi:hypothetical protein
MGWSRGYMTNVEVFPANASNVRNTPAHHSLTRRFHLVRHEDVSGVSGTGIVADGVRFPNGKAVMCWRGELSSIATYDSIGLLLEIHGHEGRTCIEWVD